MKVLFVSWDGAAQNYMESLFLPIFGRAAGDDLAIHVLQFTWASREQRRSTAAAAARAGVHYRSCRIWRHPTLLATPAMIVAGAARVAGYAARHGIDVLMPRSTIPAGMALLALKGLRGVTLLFDADGLPLDERKEFGTLRDGGAVCRFLETLEAGALARAAAVITRTAAAKGILLARAGGRARAERIHVIPNGKDAALFAPGTRADRERTRRENGVAPDAPLLAYGGSLGPQYYPLEMLRLFKQVLARRPDARLVVLTGNGEVLSGLLPKAGVPAAAVIVKRVHPDQMARELAAADLGVAFRTPTLSQRAVSPIKVSEYLLCGVPVVGTRGIGDLDAQLDESVAMLVGDLRGETLGRVAAWATDVALPNREAFRAACRHRGVRLFDLGPCATRYREAMRAAAAPPPASPTPSGRCD